MIVVMRQRLTWISRTGKVWSVRMRRWMRAEEFVMKGYRASVAELEFIRAEVRETGWRSVLAAESARI